MADLKTLHQEFCNIKDGGGGGGDCGGNETTIMDESVNAQFAKRGCCFWIPCIGSSSSDRSSNTIWWERIRTAEKEDRLWTKGWKKMREWSEIVAGPKWKTFIRRFNKNGGGGGGGGGGGLKSGKFQYDPSSYALNFDEGIGLNANSTYDDDVGYKSFSVRYAALPTSTKSSMDLGKDGPNF